MLTLGSGTISIAAYQTGANATTPGSTYTAGNLYTIGEIGGDVEFDINFQEKEFFGQANFAIAKAFYGGKVEVRARRVEVNVAALKNFFTTNSLTAPDPASFTYNPAVSGASASLPRPLYVKFTHTRSDDSAKTVNIHLFKAYSMKLTYPFTREDIAVMDIDFSAIVDTAAAVGTTTTRSILLVEAS
jgi:hypothetical protein